MNRTLRTVFLMLVALAITACGQKETQQRVYTTVTDAKLNPDSPIPAPDGEVILTITGAIEQKNLGEVLAFDMATLEKLGLVQYAVQDPWTQVEITYIGVLMSDLLQFAAVAPSAKVIHMVALDDYEVDITIADIQKWPILLATQADGDYLTIDNYGPTRIVFPNKAYPETGKAGNTDLWIWNLESIEIK